MKGLNQTLKAAFYYLKLWTDWKMVIKRPSMQVANANTKINILSFMYRKYEKHTDPEKVNHKIPARP